MFRSSLDLSTAHSLVPVESLHVFSLCSAQACSAALGRGCVAHVMHHAQPLDTAMKSFFLETVMRAHVRGNARTRVRASVCASVRVLLAHVYARAFARVFACRHACTCSRTCVRTRVYVYVFARVCVCVCVPAPVSMCTRVRVCVRMCLAPAHLGLAVCDGCRHLADGVGENHFLAQRLMVCARALARRRRVRELVCLPRAFSATPQRKSQRR
jgi:hypothetical protein